jgi:hypothetical protein
VLTGCCPSVPPRPAAPCQGTFQPVEPIIVAFPDHPPSPPSEPELNVAAIDCGDFSAYLDASKLDLCQLRPGRPYTYWEWVFGAGGYWDVIAFGGQAKRSALSPSVVDDLNRFTNRQGDGGGFAQSCEPELPCSEYIAFVADDEVSAVTALPGIRKFLGEIDTPEDVVLLIRYGGKILEAVIRLTQRQFWRTRLVTRSC